MNQTRSKFLRSTLMLFLCFSLFVGSTFAWFTDSVSSRNNVITAGNLDLEMYFTDKLDGDNTVWTNVETTDEGVFVSDNWEPGYTEVKYLKIVNKGNLAFQYKINLLSLGEVGLLAEAIDVYSTQLEAGTTVSPYDNRAKIEGMVNYGTLDKAVSENTTLSEGVLLSKKANDPLYNCGETIFAIALQMQTKAGNKYQDQTIGDGFSIQAIATQFNYEEDGFGSDYDSEAFFPKTYLPINITKGIKGLVSGGKLTEEVTINAPYGISVIIPSGVKVDNELTLSLSITDKKVSDANVKVNKDEELKAYDVHVEGIAEDNTVPMIVNMGKVLPEGLNKGNLSLYHVEDNTTKVMSEVNTLNELTLHNQFTYEPSTGELVLSMSTFSEVALLANTINPWKGKFDYTWYDADKVELTIANADQLAAFGAIVGGMNGQTQDSFKGKTIKLISDINLGDKENANEKLIFYPIGYSYKDGDSTVKSFKGTFDGNGHTISSFYQNTWEIEGDYDGTYYKDAMGLFGYVYGGTVKNLTVDNFSSDGEYTPTGVIAAYADGDAKFENIAITNCNPRVYNTGNGGIIGIAGDTSTANDDHITLKNITVDNSNKISALWGSWDVACGGLVGMYRGNVDGNGNPTQDTISFENCHVSAIIDVYNDVCANYQYYAYRYSGMIIGSVRHNTKNAEGKTIPNMTGISATGCTVNYGDWNDYYYCEFEKNSMASYSEDYQFSRVPHSELNFTDSNENGVVDANERTSVTGCKHTHTAEENHRAIYLPFHQLFTGYSWGVSSIGLKEYSGIVTDLGITEGDQEESVEKFETKFTGDFLYRVGNQNTVSLGSLFKGIDGATINSSGVVATIDKLDENSNVSGTFKANTTDWTKGTIQFSGTGVVKITIQDYTFCTPTVLTVEVVDAVNATTATSAKANNVVLLNDCGFSSLEVSGGYTLYGNGFTMECANDSAALDMGYSFVALDNGILDNVQIVTPNFDYAVLYKTNMIESGNRSETTDNRTRYFNVKSGVMVSGNSQILNSRISGGRAAVNVSAGNVLIDNSRIELGAVASILVGAANSLTLRDVTLIQKPTASTYDPSKTLMGFSVLFICDANGNAAPVTLEGTLVQNAWIDKNDSQYVPSAGQSIINTVLGKTEYLHDIDGDGKKESLNLGFAYMPESLTSKVNTTTITDERTNKNDVPYDYAEVSILNGKTYVYSYKNTNGTLNGYKEEVKYEPNKQGDNIAVNYSDTADGLTTGKTFGTDGWVYELNVDLDKSSGYALDFNKLSMSVNGVTVTDFKVNGNAKPTSPVAVTAGGTTYTLTATVNGKEYTATYKVTGTETDKESPSLVAANYEAGLCVASSYGGTWHGAAPALQGIQIKYWSVAEKQYKTINLSDYTPTTKGQLNGTNKTWTYSPANGDFTLTLTGGQVHSSNKVYAMPVVCDGKLYFVAANSKGLVNSGNDPRTIQVSYSFKDNNNGAELTFNHTWSVAENNDAQYNYSDFCKGTLTKLEANSSGGGSCVAKGTLVTLADGTKKPVEDITASDQLLVWDFFNGKYTTVPATVIANHGNDMWTVISLMFSDGTKVDAVTAHAFFDMDLNKFVLFDDKNVSDYIGHKFMKADGNSYTEVELVDYKVEKRYTGSYSLVSAKHYNFIVEDMISLTNSVSNLLAGLEVGENMKYDQKTLIRDIMKYGVYDYKDFSDYVTEEQFMAFNGPFLKISVGKGYITYEKIVDLILRFVNPNH